MTMADRRQQSPFDHGVPMTARRSDAAGGVMNDVSAARLLAMIEAEQADGWTDFRIVGHLMGYLAERAAISGDDAA